MENMVDTIVVKESKNDVKKMQEKLAKKEKMFQIMNNAGNIITAVATPGLLSWIPTPADLADGPFLEIMITVAFLAGVTMKTISKAELKKIEAMKVNGNLSYEELDFNLDEKDKNKLAGLITSLQEKTNKVK